MAYRDSIRRVMSSGTRPLPKPQCAAILVGLIVLGACAETNAPVTSPEPRAALPEVQPAARASTPAPPAPTAPAEIALPTDMAPAPPIAGAEWRSAAGPKAWAFVTEAEEADLVRDTPHSVRLHGKPVWLDLRESAGRALLKEVSRPLAVDISVDQLSEDSMVAALRSLAAKQPLRMLLYTREWLLPGQSSTPGDLGRLAEIERLDALGILGAIKPGESAKLAALKGVRELDIGGIGLRNEDLEHLRGLTKLEELEIGNNRIKDDGLAHLKGLTKLRALGLVGMQGLKGEGLKHLAELKDLRVLGLQATGFNDAGLEQLAGFVSLERLNLNDTAISDAGLVHLRKLKRLTLLRLKNTKVTDAAVVDLKKYLPTAKIER